MTSQVHSYTKKTRSPRICVPQALKYFKAAEMQTNIKAKIQMDGIVYKDWLTLVNF